MYEKVKSGIRFLCYHGFFNWMSDEPYIKLLYYGSTGEKLNLKNPQGFNAKLQWLKLHDRKQKYSAMVDKYEMKKFIGDAIGEEYVIPAIGIWDRFEDIDFNELPNEFVLKCTHDSGGLVICRDKEKINLADAKKRITHSLKTNYYLTGREWPYKNVIPRIIAEPYMEDKHLGELRDYKFFAFNGTVKVFYITSGRKAGDRRTDFFDIDLNHLDIQDDDKNADITPDFPEKLDEMISIAKKLSQGIPHLRVDFYEVNGRVYVGELTFYYLGGFVPFKPEKWDGIFGDWIDLSNI